MTTTPGEHLRGTLSLLQLIERAQRELLDAGERLERDAWRLQHEIETQLRPVRDYLHARPIGEVVDVLQALTKVERLVDRIATLMKGRA